MVGILGQVKASRDWIQRKFHRILDEISNGPAAVAPQSGEDPTDVPSKRRRIFPYSTKQTDHTSTRPGGILGKHAATNVLTLKISRDNLGYYAPWDQGQFLSRLQTFKHEQWGYKPDAISETQWAKRGWSCVGDDTVGCVGGCESRVVIDLSIEEDNSEEEFSLEGFQYRQGMRAELTAKYQEMIVNSHSEGCAWRIRGCKDSIHQIPLHEIAKSINEMLSRYENIMRQPDQLPDEVILPEGVDVAEIISMMPDSFTTIVQKNPTTGETDSVPRQIHLRAFVLALCGWDTQPDLPDITVCHFCFRRVGLWIFRTEPLGRDAIIDHLNAVTEHREYCPWRNPVTQSGHEDSPAGWKVLISTIKKSHHLRREARSGGRRSSFPLHDSSPPANNDALTPLAVRSRFVDGIMTVRPAEDGPPSPTNVDAGEEQQEQAEEAKDKERWAKLKAIRKALRLPGSKKGEN